MSTTIPPPPPPPAGGARRMAAPPPPPSTAKAPSPPAPPSAAQEKPAQATRTLTFDDIEPGFEARDGDVLVVTYGEVTIPMPKPYSNIKVGGGIYTRKLAAGDNAVAQFDRIYRYLKAVCERAAQEKVATWSAELKG